MGRRSGSGRVRIHLAWRCISSAFTKSPPQDGARVLVDRLWPRGLTKEDAALDEWLRDIAPSNELRKWYHAHPLQWSKFRQKYLKELRPSPAAHTHCNSFMTSRRSASRDAAVRVQESNEYNNAIVLKQLVEGDRKPPTGTGPLRHAAATTRKRAARRK